MTDDVDREMSGLLDGLTGEVRAERAELIPWLLEQGITADEIRASFAPMLLPARRALGDDGTYVSARQISEWTGLDVDVLTRFQRASGLPHVEDPDAAVFMRPDGDTALHIKGFIDHGIDPDMMLTVVRVLAEGLSHAAEVMRTTALAAVMHPGATELQIAQGSQALVSEMAPLLGPMIQDMLMLQLRHALETEAVNANERAAGAPLPGARLVAVAFADMVGFTRLGESVPPEELEHLANRLADAAREVTVLAGAVRQDDRRCRDAGVDGGCGTAGRDAFPGRGHRCRRGAAPAAGRVGLRPGGQPCRGLVRQSGQPGQPRHVGGPSRLGPGGTGGL